MTHISEIIEDILVEWAYRVHDGMPNPKNAQHIQQLRESMEELNLPNKVIYEVIQNLINEEDDEDEKITFNHDGEKHTVTKKTARQYASDINQGDDSEYKSAAVKAAGFGDKDTKQDKEDDSGKLSGDDFDTEKYMGVKSDKEDKSTKPTIDTEKVNNISQAIYGESGTEGLLQTSETSLQALQNGYKKGADYVAPGNAGSCFNENMSNEGVKILEQYSDLSEDELTQIIFDRTKNETLGTQIKTTSIKSPHNKDKGTIPDELKGKENKQKRDVYNASRIAARSAIAKYKRIRKAESEAQNQVGFGKKTKIDPFGGTESDLDKLKEKINSANDPIYLYDAETGKVYKVPKDVMIDWVDASGGGENPGDTAVISMDENGNLLYDGWSDKINYNALQGNSTLNDDYTKQEKNINKLVEDGRLDKETAQTALAIIKEAKQKSAEIEKNYKKAPLKEAEFFSTYIGDDRDRLIEHIKKQNEDYIESGTENHVQNAMKHYGVSTEEELLDALIDEAKNNPKIAGKRLKVIGRIANLERKHLKEKTGQIPSQLNTRQILSDAREQALDVQKDTMTRLNQLKGKTSSGKEKRLGDIIGFQETIDFLHLDKIEEPSGDDDYNAILKRNTHLVMEGTDVPPQTVKKCLGVNNLQDAEDNFEVVQDEEIMKDQETGQFTTGKIVYIYAIKKGERTFIGKKTYRSKDGPEGKTSNTIEWSPDMQECFDRNREK